MTEGYWILDDDRRPVKVADVLTWARWFEITANRNVGDDEINGVHVSTKFLGIDHQFGDGPPLLFETMIFGGEHDGFQKRCGSWIAAETIHAEACELVRGAD